MSSFQDPPRPCPSTSKIFPPPWLGRPSLNDQIMAKIQFSLIIKKKRLDVQNTHYPPPPPLPSPPPTSDNISLLPPAPPNRKMDVICVSPLTIIAKYSTWDDCRIPGYVFLWNNRPFFWKWKYQLLMQFLARFGFPKNYLLKKILHPWLLPTLPNFLVFKRKMFLNMLWTVNVIQWKVSWKQKASYFCMNLVI